MKKRMKRIFQGHSMKGIFRTGDILTLYPIDIGDARLGDVVVFYSRHMLPPKEIVHRVVHRNSCELITRGDSAKNRDAGTVNQDLLIGKVSHKERNSRVSVVHGGWIGLIKGRLLNLFWDSKRLIARSIQKPYAILKKSGIVCQIWKPDITRILINTSNGPFIQFVHNKRVIARSWPEQDKSECKKPWDLILNNNQTQAL